MTNGIVKSLGVMAGVAVLATLVLIFLDGPQQRARDASRISLVREVEAAIRHSHKDTGTYPALDAFDSMCQDLKIRKYIAKCPVDTTDLYGYAYRRTPAGFHVWVRLETSATALGSDADRDSTGWHGQVSTGQDGEYYYDLGSQ